MRARNIKPGVFHNEILGSADPLFTLIFAGLWCLADREGRLEDRPLRIHAQVNPYRDMSSTVQALDWLHARHFIVRYAHGEGRYIQILNFRKHQQPHIREAASKIPPPQENQEDVVAQCQHGAEHPPSTERARLIPDSGFLIPDSGFSQTRAPDKHSASTGLSVPCGTSAHGEGSGDEAAMPVLSSDFEQFLDATYPATSHGRNLIDAVHRAQGLIGGRLVTEAVLRERLAGFRAFVDTGGYSGPHAVPSLSNWLDRHHPKQFWARDWGAVPTKAEQRLQNNLDTTQEWLRQQEEIDRATS